MEIQMIDNSSFYLIKIAYLIIKLILMKYNAEFCMLY